MRRVLRRTSMLQNDIAQMMSEGRVKLDPIINSSDVSVQKVELSADGRNATVWWDVEWRATSKNERREIGRALEQASYNLRMTIAKARRMRVAPRIDWKWGGELITAQEDVMDETMESIRRHIVKVDPEWDPETFDLEVEEEDHTLWEQRVEEEELQSQRTGQSDWMNSGVDWWEEETEETLATIALSLQQIRSTAWGLLVDGSERLDGRPPTVAMCTTVVPRIFLCNLTIYEE